MFAKSLELILQRLQAHSDVSHLAGDDLARRFESLRGSGRLPRARERRSQHLTSREIAAALLGLTPVEPRWAGHAATVLGTYLPVGGPTAAFVGAESLLVMMIRLIESQKARHQVRLVSLSMAQSEPNISGSAHVIWDDDEKLRTTYYVHRLAASSLAPGAERDFDPYGRQSISARQLSLSRAFFRTSWW